MGTTLVACPVCKGNGTQSIIVEEFGKPGSSTTDIGCVVCNGRKRISAREARMVERERNMMCYCGNPGGETHFHDDGECSECRKHHFHCADCGKILQIG